VLEFTCECLPADACHPPGFRRCDANADGSHDLSDAVFILGFLFSGGADLSCEKSADCDDNGVLEITDAVRLLNYLFLGGPRPQEPFPDCGPDPSGDALSCQSYPASACE
jgi:hypothetical protein